MAGMTFRLLIPLVLVGLCPALSADPPEARRIVFLGDSITYNGAYVALIEAAWIAQRPAPAVEMLNLGLASETVSGLSEEGHAGGRFPRPDLHERLDRVLEQSRPDLVITCYGMNDGIYHPLDEARFATFRRGMERLREKVLAAGADLIHLTPPVFDPLPIRERVLPAGLDAYPQPFSGYDQVLAAYSDWLLAQAKTSGWRVLDIHGPMSAALAAARATNPAFSFAKDGVHPGEEGHLLMARPLLKAWNLAVRENGVPDHPHGDEILALVRKKQALLRDAWLSATGHQRPGVKPGLPLPEAQKQAAALDTEARRLAND